MNGLLMTTLAPTKTFSLNLPTLLVAVMAAMAGATGVNVALNPDAWGALQMNTDAIRPLFDILAGAR